MSLRDFKPLNRRRESNVKLEFSKKYYFAFEGAKTEPFYFDTLRNNSKLLGIHNMIEIVPLERLEEIRNDSDPKLVLQQSREKKVELIATSEFDKEVDEFVIVVDRDSFKPVDKKQEEYIAFLEDAKKDMILAITSPCFELWLLLHFDNISLEDTKKDIKEDNIEVIEAIKKYYEAFRQNTRMSKKHTFVSKAFSLTSGMNSKSNSDFDKLLLERLKYAVSKENEGIIEKDIYEMVNKVGSNIGELLEKLMSDPREAAN